jgi:outer membrane lipase/esterase
MIDLIRHRAVGKTATLTGGGIVLFVGLAGTAVGQGLPSVPGLTELQQPVADAVQQLCPPLPPPNPDGTLTQRLSNSCTKMVVSSLANQGQTVPQNFNLMISNSQIATGLQAIAPVQMNAQKQIGVEASKANLIGARLLNLRSGARGVVVGLNEQSTQAGAANPQNPLRGATGGGAAADDVGGGPWGGFLNVAYSWGKVDQTTLQDAYKYGSFSLLAGADYRVSDKFVLGGAIGYSDTHSDYEQSLGDVKARTVSALGYGTYYVDDWYVDGMLAYGSVDYDSTRNINIPSNNPSVAPIVATATSSPKGQQWSAAIGVGRNYTFEDTIVTPFLRLGYIWVKNKAFSEDEPIDGLGLAVNDRTVRSLQSALGARVSKSISTSSGVFTPYFSAQWMHEFENDNPSIVSRYVADPTNQFFAIPTAGPTRDYAVLVLGSSATFPNNLSGFLQLSAAAGLQNETNYGVVAGLRKQF